MAEWTETYRGIVSPWECDITEHFTIAYYFDRLEEASASALAALGIEGAGQTRRLDLRFMRELRAGASFHILSGPLAVDGGEVRLAHRIVDSGNGEAVTWVEESLVAAALPGELREAVAARRVAWEGPAIEPRAAPKTQAGFIPTARDRVKPADLNGRGELSLAGFVHRFTAACLQALAAIGWTAEYTEKERRGYSTFELKLDIARRPRLGEAVRVDTGIVHLGNSSLRFLHRMSAAANGEELGSLGQFGVQLDLDARRPAALPPEIRERVAALLAPTGN